MTDEPVPGNAAVASPPDASVEFVQLWTDCLAQVLAQIAGAPLPVNNLPERPEAVPPSDPSDVQIIVAASGGVRGEMSLLIPKPAARAIAGLFLGEAPAPGGELQPDHGQALEELVRQVAGYVATAVKGRWGEVQLQAQIAAAPSWAVGASGWWASASATPIQVWVEWKLSAALHSALSVVAPAKAVDPAPAAASGRQPTQVVAEGNLDLLMDVGLEVTLRFGERSLLLREILELGAGAVVELDRKVGEPADLLLDGRVVARGEVVVVDGDYGLRVLQIVTPPLAALPGGD